MYPEYQNSKLRVVCLIGWSGSGKTTLLTRLLPILRRQGARVLALKHSAHPHPLHKPGSDTEQLEQAGAAAVGFATPAGVALTLPGDPASLLADLLPRLSGAFDLVLVEGWKDGPFPKIEVWRPGLGPRLGEGRSDVKAVVSDEALPGSVRRFRSDDVDALATFILELVRHAPEAGE